MHRFIGWAGGLLLYSVAVSSSLSGEPFRISVREKGTGWPVPLIELRTTDHYRWVTDNAGVVAFDLPEAMGHTTWLSVSGHGYEVPADGLGSRGVQIHPSPGGSVEIEVVRKNVAQRVGRLTGAGLFAESEKCDPTMRKGIDLGIVGCDSIQNAVHRGRLYWFWGDTTLRKYPLGIFHATGATTGLPPQGKLVPPLRMPLEYFVDDEQQPKAVAKMPGDGPTWLTGVVSLNDRQGTPRLVASYMKVKPPLTIYQWGLAVWNESSQVFEPLRIVWTQSEDTPKAPPIPEGHAVQWTDEQGKAWILFGNPFPRLRCPDSFEAWQDPATWEPLQFPSVITSVTTVDAPKSNSPDTAGAASQGPNSTEAPKHEVVPHSGSLAWNPYRKKWIGVFMEHFGKPSGFGEVWYVEGTSPLGPWGRAVKIVSH
ncbi:MAG: hypothetical protein RIS70_3844, partial [Planctomycetota bacterium]